MQLHGWSVRYVVRGRKACLKSDFTSHLLLPLSNLLLDPLYHILGCAVLPKRLDEFTVWVHEVDIYRMVYEIVAFGVRVGRGGEIHPICFTNRFGGGVIACKPNDPGVEIREILFHLGTAVASWVDRNEDRLKFFSIFRFYDGRDEHTQGMGKNLWTAHPRT